MNKLKQKEIIVEIMNEDAKDGLYKKQTAVEWLEKEVKKRFGGETFTSVFSAEFEKAKQMEKQQIVDATCLNKYVNEDDREIGEQYYNEEYGGNK